ncbi:MULTISPECIES: glycoside hydrolase family 105 protein [Asticcacaulis]|uniref:glycoside hydrolase family 88/105 protein n=1 Tax=Asticcacaulis TaxID=76890 RepID=UPI001AE2831A|nr:MULTISPECIES: glycoside hydrolase family 88 protein [Asticcacaulis]MBP2160381.1 unsaturated rhamnogalacturonyl hydrolase [Asticcacaulis solisilvae]MDR6801316.1 unsaturated rhamnogalacturonyl hydrolase [Asticcacaulis sp. BE141]
MMDRRAFCAGAAALIPISQGKASAAQAFRPDARTLEQLAAVGRDVPAFVASYLTHFQPQKSLWGYEDGVVWAGILTLFDATGDRAFLDYILEDMQAHVTGDGALPAFQPKPYNIDMIRAGAILLPLHRETGQSRFRKAMDTQFAPLKDYPRTRSGNYWHKARYPWQVWLDGLYMGQPFQLHYAQVTGNPALFDDTLNQIRTVEKVMRQTGTGLYYHGWDESRQQRWADRDTGLSPHIWGRGMGWWLCALVDTYEASEGFDAEGRAEIARILKAALEAMLAVRSRDGLWYQVVDQGTRAGNYEEASASLMTTYALLKAARLGVAGDDMRRAGIESLKAAIGRFLTPAELNGICRVAGLGGDPYRDGSYEYYLSEKIVANDPKGVGPFFMAVAEAMRVAA